MFIAHLLSFFAQQMSFIIHIYANAKYCNHCGTEKDESEQNMCDCDVTLSFSLTFNFPGVFVEVLVYTNMCCC